MKCPPWPPLGGAPGHVAGVCDWCGYGGNTRRGLCSSCYNRSLAGAVANPSRLTNIELVNEIIFCGSRDPADLAGALGFTPVTLAARLRRVAANLERKGRATS